MSAQIRHKSRQQGDIWLVHRADRSHCPSLPPRSSAFAQPIPMGAGYAITCLGRRALRELDDDGASDDPREQAAD